MLKNGYIAYAIVQIRGENAAEVATRMGQVVEIAGNHGIGIDVLCSGFVIFSRGAFPGHEDKPSVPFSVVLLKIISELNQHVRIAYCGEVADFGQLGAASRYTFSFIAPSFAEVMRRLLATEFGKISEMS